MLNPPALAEAEELKCTQHAPRYHSARPPPVAFPLTSIPMPAWQGWVMPGGIGVLAGAVVGAVAAMVAGRWAGLSTSAPVHAETPYVAMASGPLQ